MTKYAYYGGYDWSIDNFNASEDVLWLPNAGNGDVTVEKYWNTLYVRENGGTLTVNGYFGFVGGGEFKYSVGGFEEIQASIINSGYYGDYLRYSDDTLVYFGTGSTELYVGWCYDKDIRIGDTPSNGKYYLGIKDIEAYGGNSILWGNEQDNVIKIVGNTGNNNLWGGYGGNDTLTGSEGSDFFLYESGGGHDIITHADRTDTICIFNANPGDCSYNYDDTNNVMHIYVGGGELEVNCSTGDEYYPMTYPVYQFADGTRLTYVNREWQGVSWDMTEDVSVDSPFSLFDDSGEFVYSYGDGRKDIFSTNDENLIVLDDVTLDQISSAEITNSGVNLKFNDGGSLNIYGQTGDFIVNGESYRADYQNKTWNTKS